MKKMKEQKEEQKNEAFDRVFLEKNPCTAMLNLYFIRDDFESRYINFAKPVILSSERKDKYAAGGKTDPTLVIDQTLAHQLFLELRQYFEKEGVKLENEHKVYGKLEATEKHLEDMRRLVFSNIEKK